MSIVQICIMFVYHHFIMSVPIRQLCPDTWLLWRGRRLTYCPVNCGLENQLWIPKPDPIVIQVPLSVLLVFFCVCVCLTACVTVLCVSL